MLVMLLSVTFSRARLTAALSMSTAIMRFGLKRSFIINEITPPPQPASITMSVDLPLIKFARAIASEVKFGTAVDWRIFTPLWVKKSRSVVMRNNRFL